MSLLRKHATAINTTSGQVEKVWPSSLIRSWQQTIQLNRVSVYFYPRDTRTPALNTHYGCWFSPSIYDCLGSI